MKLSLKKRQKYRLSVLLFSGIIFYLLILLTNSTPPRKCFAEGYNNQEQAIIGQNKP